jgi:hypothetical protein
MVCDSSVEKDKVYMIQGPPGTGNTNIKDISLLKLTISLEFFHFVLCLYAKYSFSLFIRAFVSFSSGGKEESGRKSSKAKEKRLYSLFLKIQIQFPIRSFPAFTTKCEYCYPLYY